jgi:hypothetical protein
MKITKESQGGEAVLAGEEDLRLINALSRKELKAEEVYLFSVRLCDNEVDRDGERFSTGTLEELAGMFVGKSGIFDHQWSASGQAARIYKTEVVREPENLTQAGDGYCWLKGYAYMVRTERTRDLICEIEAGIKKEVSVGCAVERSVCSICGADLRQGACGHRKGEYYDGQLCFVSLEGAKDAYEFSFVAVPAQPKAGVVKGAGQSGLTLKELTAENVECRKELERLEEEAALGRQYLGQLREDVLRLGLLSGLGLEREMLKSLTDKLSCGELTALKEAYGSRAAERYPIKTQLTYGEKTADPGERDGAFLI